MDVLNIWAIYLLAFLLVMAVFCLVFLVFLIFKGKDDYKDEDNESSYYLKSGRYKYSDDEV